MSRNLDPALSAALPNPNIQPVVLVMLTFRSSTQYACTYTGDVVWNGMTFKGTGSLGSVGTITEGVEVSAAGTSVTLSGIDPTLYAECMTDIQLGAPAKIWYGQMANGQLIGNPFLTFAGQIDKPEVTLGVDSISITLSLENLMTNLQRPSNRRYTSADQQVQYPDDTAFHRVELLNDMALLWGS